MTRIKDSIVEAVSVALLGGLVALGAIAVFALHAFNVIATSIVAIVATISRSRALYFAAGFVVGLLVGCPGGGEETAPGDPETCCACLYDAFPAPGEPCIYESPTSCQEGVKEGGSGPDTWGVCLAELCGDVCDGVGPFDVIRWEP